MCRHTLGRDCEILLVTSASQAIIDLCVVCGNYVARRQAALACIERDSIFLPSQSVHPRVNDV